jgi:tRNA A37 threonylcarbamoyladenosine modification protein TsaB
VLSGAAGVLFFATVLVLAFDTATPAVTVAVSDERRVLARPDVAATDAPRRQLYWARYSPDGSPPSSVVAP